MDYSKIDFSKCELEPVDGIRLAVSINNVEWIEIKNLDTGKALVRRHRDFPNWFTVSTLSMLQCELLSKRAAVVDEFIKNNSTTTVTMSPGEFIKFLIDNPGEWRLDDGRTYQYRVSDGAIYVKDNEASCFWPSTGIGRSNVDVIVPVGHKEKTGGETVTGVVRFIGTPTGYNYANGDEPIYDSLLGLVGMRPNVQSLVEAQFIDTGVIGKLEFEGSNADLRKLPKITNKTRLRITIETVEYD